MNTEEREEKEYLAAQKGATEHIAPAKFREHRQPAPSPSLGRMSFFLIPLSIVIYSLFFSDLIWWGFRLFFLIFGILLAVRIIALLRSEKISIIPICPSCDKELNRNNTCQSCGLVYNVCPETKGFARIIETTGDTDISEYSEPGDRKTFGWTYHYETTTYILKCSSCGKEWTYSSTSSTRY